MLSVPICMLLGVVLVVHVCYLFKQCVVRVGFLLSLLFLFLFIIKGVVLLAEPETCIPSGTERVLLSRSWSARPLTFGIFITIISFDHHASSQHVQ